MMLGNIGSAKNNGMAMAQYMLERDRQRKVKQAAGGAGAAASPAQQGRGRSGSISKTSKHSDDGSVTSALTDAPSLSSKKSRGSIFGGLKRMSGKKSKEAIPIEVVATGEETRESKIISAATKKQQEGEATLVMLERTIESQDEALSRMSKDIVACKQSAKEQMQAGNKRGALRFMKKAKRCELETEKINSVIESLEQMQLSIERAVDNLKVMEALQVSSQQLSNLQGTKTVDKLDELMDTIRDSNDIALEVNELLSADVTAVILDDDDLLKELEMEMGNSSPTAAVMAPLPSFPEVPRTTPVLKERPAETTKEAILY